MEMVRIGILGVAGVIIALQFKTVKPEISLYIGFAVCIVIFTFSVNGMMQILSKMEELQKYISGSDSYFALLFKAVGITYISEFCASICKDAGYGAVAGQIEIFGKLTVLFMGMPVLMAVIENISSIAG
ncbi:MAG: stage III sporulation protein AD [Lachnospiraceae bacterium]|nr:stage III sporulation protein AD [Lachnospiraceae bacterium]MDD7626848.1 SpoIIIAC/SpoIIIAD family protein [Lachnospiraceae bacterium]MDY4118567.1 SpoIIIAC/SpoIIIAD family protein [Lachnospiraceae bacterium]